ncbi:MBOAT family O-acyltransferase [Sunxiuqinia sp. A32]|uniref:MBOAT family O-acyltransferase n=1 Tax=Sunxiuqinia sp. A32 TaxID=3461496 RepID=UPI00404569F6
MIFDRVQHTIENIWQYRPDEPLFYTGLAFWLVFTLFLGVYSFIYKKNQVRNIYLLAISWFIYYQMNGAFLSLLIVSCLSNFGFGILIEKHRKKGWLITAVAVNLLLLGYFKYAYFVTDAFNSLFDSDLKVVNWIGILLNQVMKDAVDIHSILLPIGISFYTFQAISYVVDVYNNKTESVKNVLDFSFYLSFFPQLVAGPIVRASSFIPQLYQKYQLSREEFSHAVFLISKGLFKKMVIADFLATNFIDRIFEAPLAYSGIENLFAVYTYSIQIYCDFSGYTDIAIGLALILGFKIPVNFNSPYKSTSLTDFWHRWHISLSLWLKDYLYIPLGGNRKGAIRTYTNLLITMLLGGLWHGANIRFIIWGLIHGLGLVIEKASRKIFNIGNHLSRWKEILAVFFTFQLVSIAWVFFRAKDFRTVLQMFNQLKYHFVLKQPGTEWKLYLPVIGVFLLGLILSWFPAALKEKIRGWFIHSTLIAQGILVVFVLLTIAFVFKSGIQPFIYFRF